MLDRLPTSENPILVTGAAGFIGFHTSLHLLQQGRSVVGVDNMNDYYDVQLKQDRLSILQEYPSFQFEKLNIADRQAMESLWARHGSFKEVVHLAAQAGVRHSLVNPYDYITSNCMGHLTVLEMCRHTPNFRHLVYASSSSVYGSNKKLPYSVQDSTDHPISLYAATKRADELFSYSYSHLYKIPQTGLRFFTVYGPWGRPDMSPFIFANAIATGEELPVFNHGQMKRDFTYIDDIVSGIISVLDLPPSGDVPQRVLNLGNTKSESVMDFIRVLQDSLGINARLDLRGMQAGDVKDTCADITETAELIGFSPKVSIHEGVPRFVEWFKSYYGIFSPSSLTQKEMLHV